VPQAARAATLHKSSKPRAFDPRPRSFDLFIRKIRQASLAQPGARNRRIAAKEAAIHANRPADGPLPAQRIDKMIPIQALAVQSPHREIMNTGNAIYTGRPSYSKGKLMPGLGFQGLFFAQGRDGHIKD
jgi:hypothetical protein